MATDQTGIWSLGESILLYSPSNYILNTTWSDGESYLIGFVVMSPLPRSYRT